MYGLFLKSKLKVVIAHKNKYVSRSDRIKISVTALRRQLVDELTWRQYEESPVQNERILHKLYKKE